jgi:tetratricopeptide (TPR) repeat protein
MAKPNDSDKSVTLTSSNGDHSFQAKPFLSSSSLLKLLVCLFLILVTLAAFWQARHNEFISLDDNLYVTENPQVQAGLTVKGLVWALTTTQGGNWHPITWLSHMLDCNLYGLNPGGHHMTNVFFHVANTLLLFLLFQKMTGALWRSAFVAALFALHPLHVESVAWVAERKDVLSTFFWFLTMGMFVRYVEQPRLDRYLFALLCFVLGLMSKPMLITLPFVLLLLDYWPLGRLSFGPLGARPLLREPSTGHHQGSSPLRLILEKAPFFALSAASSVVTVFAQRRAGAVGSLEAFPMETRLANSIVSYARYIGKMVWPHDLAVLYPYPEMIPLWQVVMAGLLLIAGSIILIRWAYSRPYLVIGWFWYLGTLVPVIGLVQVGIQAMADRYTYVPFIGLFIMIAMGLPGILKQWRHRQIALAVSAGLVLSVLCLLTRQQVSLWQNSVTLFNHTLKVTGDNPIIHNNLGVTLMKQGKEKEAWAHYTRALEIKSKYADAQYNLGFLLARQGKDQEAMAQFAKTLRIKPSHAEAHHDLGVLLTRQGKIEEAIQHYIEAVRAKADYGEAYRDLGIVLVSQGREKEAVPYFREALEINPKDYIAHNNLGAALSREGRIGEAMAHYTQALQINPISADAHYNLGSLLALQGKDGEAMVHLNEALRINPRDAQGHYQMAAILDRQGKTREAIVHLSEAVEILPNYGEGHLALGMLYLRMGKKDLALEKYKILKAINMNLADRLYQNISKDSR